MHRLIFCLPILVWVIWTGFSMWKHSDPDRVCTTQLAVCTGSVFLLSLILSEGGKRERLVAAVGTAFKLIQGDSQDFLALTETAPALVGLFQSLSILTPVLTAGTVFVLLFRRLPLPVLLPWKCHIFSALDDHAVLLAKSIAGQERARFIFLRTEREKLSADTLLELRGLRVSFYPHGETQLLRRHLSLRLRSLRFYFLTEKSEENFDQMDEFLKQAKDHHLFLLFKKREHRELYLLSETTSAPMLIDELRKTYSGLPGTELRLLDRYRAAGLHLLKTAPLYDANREGNVRVLLLGMGQVGRSLYRTMVSMGVMGAHQPVFHLCDKSIQTIIDVLKQQYPELVHAHQVTKKELDAEGTKLDDLLREQPFDYIVVALGDDERNLRVTAALYRHYRKQYWSGSLTALPRICLNLEDETRARSAKRIYPRQNLKPWEPGVTVFGTDEEVFSADVLLPRGLWLAARKLHTRISDSDPSPEWCEYERRSSIAAAAHAEVHAASVLDDIHDPGYLQMAEQHLADLVESEHQRWMNYVRSEGMTLAQESIWSAYAPKLGNHVDVRGQLSPCLVGTAELDKLYDKLRPYLSNQSLTFRQRDELVVRNADLLLRLRETADPAIELRDLPPAAP